MGITLGSVVEALQCVLLISVVMCLLLAAKHGHLHRRRRGLVQRIRGEFRPSGAHPAAKALEEFTPGPAHRKGIAPAGRPLSRKENRALASLGAALECLDDIGEPVYPDQPQDRRQP